MTNDSRDQGESQRTGDLTAVLTVKVTKVEPNGVLDVEGGRKVTVDGRLQDLALKGAIRSDDVLPGNIVQSSRVSDAVITYKGKAIGPRTGIAGKFLGMLWP